MRASFFILCFLLVACVRVPSLSGLEAVGVEEAADKLLAQIGTDGKIPSEWPEQIRALNPSAVRVNADGLYIVTSSWFVEEAGIFVPRHPESFFPVAGSDPEYWNLYGHVFSYRIRG